jgi:hypothetical protein
MNNFLRTQSSTRLARWFTPLIWNGLWVFTWVFVAFDLEGYELGRVCAFAAIIIEGD